MTQSNHGTYVLEITLTEAVSLEVGALGTRAFDSGTYLYVGSAFGPGGFARVERHRELAQGTRDTRHWHIDYLLGHPASVLEDAILFPDEDRECELATTLPGEPIRDFGASDCNCTAHLLAVPDGDCFQFAL